MSSPLARVTTIVPARIESTLRVPSAAMQWGASPTTPGLLTAAASALRSHVLTVAESPFYVKYEVVEGPPLGTGKLR